MFCNCFDSFFTPLGTWESYGFGVISYIHWKGKPLLPQMINSLLLKHPLAFKFTVFLVFNCLYFLSFLRFSLPWTHNQRKLWPEYCNYCKSLKFYKEKQYHKKFRICFFSFPCLVSWHLLIHIYTADLNLLVWGPFCFCLGSGFWKNFIGKYEIAEESVYQVVHS